MKTYIFNHSKLNVNWRSKIFILFFTIVSFVSCTDLSESTYTFINPGTYYNTEEEVSAAVEAVRRIAEEHLRDIENGQRDFRF